MNATKKSKESVSIPKKLKVTRNKGLGDYFTTTG